VSRNNMIKNINFSNVFKNISSKFSTLILSLILSASALTGLVTPSASALTLNGGSDCSPNSVINCGVISTSQLTNYLPGHTAILDFYANSFGINAADISNLNNTTQNANEDYTVAGTVNVNNDVIVNGKVIATNAITGGREDISNNYGSSQKVTYDGYNFYIRTPRVSFAVASMDAFVVMKNGVFQFAILAPCGNPVKATPVKPTTPIVPVTPTTPTYSCTALTLNVASSDLNTVVMDVTHASANGAVYNNVNYAIKNDTTGVTTSLTAGDTNVNYTFTDYGLQTITATVDFTLDSGKTDVAATSPECVKSITIAAPSTPSYACLLLTVSNDPANADSIIATSTYTASNGATFSGVSYDFGDNSTPAVVTDSSNLTVNHTYTNPGTYLVSATYTFTVGTTSNSVSSANCEVPVTFAAPVTPMCTIPGLEQYPANSPYCVVAVIPKNPKLVNTGPGGLEAFALVLGIASIASGTAYYLIVRFKTKDLL